MVDNDLQNVKLRWLFLFKAVYDESCLTRASLRLGIDQTTAYNMLKNLEKRIGNQKLFVKKNNAFQPTSVSHRIYQPVSDILEHAEIFYHTARSDDVNRSLTTKLAASDLFNLVFSNRLTNHVRSTSDRSVVFETIPSTSDKQIYTGIISRFEDGHYDLLIHHDSDVFNAYPYEEIYQDQWVFICSKRTYEMNFCANPIEILTKLPILSSGVPAVDGYVKTRLHDQATIESNLHSFSLVPEAVYTNDKIGIVPSRVMKTRTINRKLFHTFIPDGFDLPRFALYQFWRAGSANDSAIMDIRNTIKEICSSEQ